MESEARKRAREHWSKVESHKKPKLASIGPVELSGDACEIIDLTSDKDESSDASTSKTNVSERSEIRNLNVTDAGKRPEAIFPFKVLKSQIYDAQRESEHFITLEEIFDAKDLVKTWLFSFQFELDYILPMFQEHVLITIVAQKGTVLAPTQINSKVSRLVSQLKTVEIVMPPFACHHSKMIINRYRDGSCRVYIPSNNFTSAETNLPQQIVWCSPRLKTTTNGTEIHSLFRTSLVNYLRAYPVSFEELTRWLATLDFGPLDQTNAMFVFSCPTNSAEVISGIAMLDSIFKDKSPSNITSAHRISHYLCQVSTIGAPLKTGLRTPGNLFTHLMVPLFSGLLSAGRDPKKIYHIENLESTFEKHNIKPYIVYPTAQEVRSSPMGYLSGGWFHFHWMKNDIGKAVYKTLKKRGFLYKRNVNTNSPRSSTPSHTRFYIKSTTSSRNEIPFEKADWFMFTSANLSLNAWGTTTRKPQNYEVGVLYKPKSDCHISVRSVDDLVYGKFQGGGRKLHTDNISMGKEIHAIVPFEIPPVSYVEADDAFCISHRYPEPDILGQYHQEQ